MAALSTSTIDNSAAGFTSILAMTKRATLISSSSETSMPDSLDTSMLMIGGAARSANGVGNG